MRLEIFDDEQNDAFMWGNVSDDDMARIIEIIGEPDTIEPLN